MTSRPSIARSLVATAAAATLSGAPSTLHNLTTHRSLLASVRAAATLVPGRAPAGRDPGGHPASITAGDVLAGAAAHAAVSLFWGTVLARVLPPGRRAIWGTVAGAAIHVIDLGLVARLPRFAPMRALPQLPQLGDHLVFGATMGFVLDQLEPPRRAGSGRDDGPAPAGTDPSSANRNEGQAL